MRFLFNSERDRLLNNILSNSNSDIESITLERFEDMSEDDLRSIVLIGNGRIRHAYRPESLYSQYLSRRGLVRDPQDPSYILTQEDLNNIFNNMRRRYSDFQPQIFQEENNIQVQSSKIIPDEVVPIYNRNLQNEPHPLLSGRNSYLDDLEREFNDMINRREHSQYTRERKPQEYDKGKGPGGFPMRGSSSSSNVGIPAQEPLFEPHRILLYDPYHSYVPTKQQIHSLAYTYNISPYKDKNTEMFSPGNNTKITSEKMPEWMTVDPLRRDKVSFLTSKKIEKQIKDNYPERSYLYELPKQYIEVPIENRETPNIWYLVLALVIIFLSRRYFKK